MPARSGILPLKQVIEARGSNMNGLAGLDYSESDDDNDADLKLPTEPGYVADTGMQSLTNSQSAASGSRRKQGTPQRKHGLGSSDSVKPIGATMQAANQEATEIEPDSDGGEHHSVRRNRKLLKKCTGAKRARSTSTSSGSSSGSGFDCAGYIATGKSSTGPSYRKLSTDGSLSPLDHAGGHLPIFGALSERYVSSDETRTTGLRSSGDDRPSRHVIARGLMSADDDDTEGGSGSDIDIERGSDAGSDDVEVVGT